MIYEYMCTSCNSVEELNRRVADRDNYARCACGLGELKRTLTAPRGFKLKGDGFYKPAAKPQDGDE